MQRRFRLRRNQDFQRLRREGMVQHHRVMLLSFARNQLSHNRYGFVTSKALGKAVVRNHKKRQLREIMRLIHPQLKSGYDIVIIARPSIVEQPFDEMKRIVIHLLERADLLSEGM